MVHSSPGWQNGSSLGLSRIKPGHEAPSSFSSSFKHFTVTITKTHDETIPVSRSEAETTQTFYEEYPKQTLEFKRNEAKVSLWLSLPIQYSKRDSIRKKLSAAIAPPTPTMTAPSRRGSPQTPKKISVTTPSVEFNTWKFFRPFTTPTSRNILCRVCIFLLPATSIAQKAPPSKTVGRSQSRLIAYITTG
jgi:hypothetical protein